MAKNTGPDAATEFRELTDDEKAFVERRTREVTAEADKFYARRPRRFGAKAAGRKTRTPHSDAE